MDEFKIDELDNMKRADLQKFCKEFGLKANGKNSEMIDRLREYHNQQKSVVTAIASETAPTPVVEQKVEVAVAAPHLPRNQSAEEQR